LAFGELVHLLRRERHESQRVVAARVPMSVANLSRMERGIQSPPSDDVIRNLAAALEADPGELLRAAGRIAGEESFEEFVRMKLTAIARDVETMVGVLTRDERH
jgi:transcriptional regulator with XRE-family HTH domain